MSANLNKLVVMLEMQNAMNIDMVVKKIYTAYINGEHKLILDGRPK